MSKLQKIIWIRFCGVFSVHSHMLVTKTTYNNLGSFGINSKQGHQSLILDLKNVNKLATSYLLQPLGLKKKKKERKNKSFYRPLTLLMNFPERMEKRSSVSSIENSITRSVLQCKSVFDGNTWQWQFSSIPDLWGQIRLKDVWSLVLKVKKNNKKTVASWEYYKNVTSPEI